MKETDILKRKKNWIPIIILVVSLSIVSVVAALVVHSKDPMKKLEEQLALGDRYLDEMNYDMAVSAYKAALEIEPTNAKAYLGLADAYVGQGKFEEAIDNLARGYELTADSQILECEVNTILDWADKLFSEEELEYAIKVLREGLERTADERISKRISEIESYARQQEEQKQREEETRKRQSVYDDFLKQVYDHMSKADHEKMVELTSSEDLGPVLNQMNEDGIDRLVYAPEGNADTFSGESAGVYIETFGIGYYYGEYDSGNRSGHGILARYVSEDCHTIFEGQWENDKANGEGVIIDEDMSGIRKIRGNFVDGLQDGTMEFNVCFKTGMELDSFGDGWLTAYYNVSNGISEIIEERALSEDGLIAYVAVHTEGHGILWGYRPESGDRHGVWGVQYYWE